jgi:hypothetical protein
MADLKPPLPATVRLHFLLRTTNGALPAEGVYAVHLAAQLKAAVKAAVKPEVSIPRALGREVIVTVRLDRADEAAAQRVKDLVEERWKSRLREITVLERDRKGRAGLLIRWPSEEETNQTLGRSYTPRPS